MGCECASLVSVLEDVGPASVLCLGDLTGVKSIVTHITEDLKLLNLIEFVLVPKSRFGNDLEDLGLGHFVCCVCEYYKPHGVSVGHECDTLVSGPASVIFFFLICPTGPL